MFLGFNVELLCHFNVIVTLIWIKLFKFAVNYLFRGIPHRSKLNLINQSYAEKIALSDDAPVIDNIIFNGSSNNI